MDACDMTDPDGVFGQFWEKFRFPDYFGWNWSALLDCLRDLNWLPADRYMVVIDNAGALLSGAVEELHLFVRALEGAAEAWANSRAKPGRTGVPFKVLLFCEPGELPGDLHRTWRDHSTG
ncbi:hypothetical protein AC230_10465 [Streptomyces caatingaensis]|uniref:Barstar (barnase inhibitor) domain-containing protein n=2 Tax=Streptomyces caatingaensis TaxID=1678637 RepID=A0A0K9XJ63_9ACTN|nr:hypothetical protein AC230_10465 [Streptomyces caatingaensis]